jgi:hypothetical protein
MRMTFLSSPSLARRPQRGGLRQTQFSHSRARVAGHGLVTRDTAAGITPDCVFKRFPAIGDTPSSLKQPG